MNASSRSVNGPESGLRLPLPGLTPFSMPSTLSRLHCGGVPKRSNGADCKSVGSAFAGSNPAPSTKDAPGFSPWACAHGVRAPGAVPRPGGKIVHRGVSRKRPGTDRFDGVMGRGTPSWGAAARSARE